MASCYVCIEQGADHVWRPRTREGRAMASCYVWIEQGADHVWRPRTSGREGDGFRRRSIMGGSPRDQDESRRGEGTYDVA
jgi:hypothetical protein